MPGTPSTPSSVSEEGSPSGSGEEDDGDAEGEEKEDGDGDSDEDEDDEELNRRTALGAGVEKISRHKDYTSSNPGSAATSPDPAHPTHPHAHGQTS
ncbi:hypothetical protein EIP91_002650 [Steccherinum ochraceum]|uniref:Uncharacterized protein n=1 Tax=Steccherinum ochraceum TaxID=92696 RepID=A0A4R0RXA5_9APHY|nr:hypothetical protein EIP91_002650 [Steccherinum ochraceum]